EHVIGQALVLHPAAVDETVAVCLAEPGRAAEWLGTVVAHGAMLPERERARVRRDVDQWAVPRGRSGDRDGSAIAAGRRVFNCDDETGISHSIEDGRVTDASTGFRHDAN